MSAASAISVNGSSRYGVVELTEVLSAAATGRAGREALHSVAAAYRAYAHRRPGVYAAIQRAPEGGDDERAAAAARLVEVLTAVLRGYGLEGDDAIHAVRLLRSALHGFVIAGAAPAGSRCRSGWRRPMSG